MRINRLGCSSAEEYVNQCIAIVSLDGVRPSTRAIELAHQVANGEISADDAVAILCNYYTSESTL